MHKLIALSVLAVTMAVTSTAQAHDVSAKRYAKLNTSTWYAIEFAGPIFRVSPSRLHYRVSREGGHTSWVYNRQGSSAGGPFQFMSGTYYAYSGAAFRLAHRRGYHVPWKYNSWYSKLGQSITAAYMFSLGLECSRVGWAASC